jgi:uncharacterized repeat protein (TIGR01451 family)
MIVSAVRAWGVKVSAALAIVGVLMPTTRLEAAGSAATQPLKSHVPKITRALTPTGDLADTERMHISIVLPWRNQDALKTLLDSLYDPTNPNYRKFLTPQKFTEQFGPTQEDYAALRKYAADNQLKVVSTAENRSRLTLELAAGDVKKLLNINLKLYKHPTEGRSFYAPDREPSLNLQVPVLRVEGLDNLNVPKPMFHRNALPSTRPLLGSGSGGNYLGADFRDAYVPGVTLTGSGQSVALFELDGYFPGDISAYQTLASLNGVVLTNVLVDGYSGAAGFNNGEVALDIEMVVALANGVDKILVYETQNDPAFNGDLLNKIVTDNTAHQISSSWGIVDDPTFDAVYQEMAAVGQSFFQAAGDDGAFTVNSIANGQGSDSPYITLVGGTTLSTSGPFGNWQSETVWNWNSTGTGTAAGGGGISPTYAIPSYQQGVNMRRNGGSTSFRNIPDVALTADNIWVISDNGVGGSVGGTSAAAPLWAAFTALVNQQAANVGQPPLGFINPAIYTIGKGPLYNQCFHDITTGNNTNANSPNAFFATRGYDLCSGWGTPSGSNLINALAPLTPMPILAIQTNIISGGNNNGVVDFNECNNLTVVITNEGRATATHVQGILQSSSFPNVTVGQTVVSFPDIPPHSSVLANGFFTINTQPTFVCGTPVNLTLVLKSDQVVQTNQIQLPSGVLAPPVGFTNSTPIILNGSLTAITNSPVTVNGITSIGKVTVSTYISTLFDEGLTLQLVSPGGQTVTLTSLNGFGSDFGSACSPLTSETTFDDDATSSIALANPPFIGSFVPQQPLSALNLLTGTNVNGIWKLQMRNAFSGLTAQLNCWSLNISPYLCQDGGGQCPGADLGVAISSSPNPDLVSSNFVMNVSVTNGGPSSAEGVVVNLALDPTVSFVVATNLTLGNVSAGAGGLSWDVGTLPVGGTATSSIVVLPLAAQVVTNTATIGYPGTDPNTANNTAVSTVVVTVPSVDVGVSMVGAPNPAPVGGLVDYTLTVTNNGPFTAFNVTLTNILPANANVVSVTTSQGSANASGSVIQLGTLQPATNAIIDIVIRATATGPLTLTSQASVDPSETDSVLANNVASSTVTVAPAADLAIAAVSTPNPVISGSNYTYVISITNLGPSGATAVGANQTLPNGVALVSTSLNLVTNANGLLSWNLGNLASGASVTISNVVTAPTLVAGLNQQTLVSTVGIAGQPSDPNTNNNYASIRTIAEPPTVAVSLTGVTLTSESFAPPDGAVEPGETVGVEFYLQNSGTIPTANLVATLQSSGGVTLPSSPQTYGVLTPGSPAVGRIFTFTAASTNGGTVVATLQLQNGSTNYGNITYTFVMPTVATFWNTNLISIPAQQFIPAPDSGPANPYPSVVSVSGITNFVQNVTVTLSNLSHTFPHDISMLLVGPGGQKSILMSAAANHSSVSNATVTFDQSAALALPASGQVVSGSYQPENYNPTNFFPANAPVGPYTANLSRFAGLSGTNISGAWSLYAFDNSQGDSGAVANGWAVTVTTITPVNQIADVSASVATTGSSTLLGGAQTNTITVANNGPGSAANVVVTNVLSSGLSFSSTSLPQSAYTLSGQSLVYNLGTLASGSNLSFTVVSTATAVGAQSDTASVGTTQIDPNLGNNVLAAAINVNLPVADLVASISASNAVPVGGTLTYSLKVSNLGPNTALSATGLLKAGAGMQLVSALPSQGSAVVESLVATNDAALANFGDIPAGGSATLTVVGSAITAGTANGSWTVSSVSSDPVSSNNVASLAVAVSTPHPIIIADGVTLVSQGQTPAGTINPNQAVTVAFTLENVGLTPTASLIATLQSSGGVTPGGVASQTYGAIAPGATATENFTFTAHGSPGAVITATLALTDGTNSYGNVAYTFLLPLSSTFTNSTGIIIPDSGAGNPYPSVIVVTNITGVVSKASVTLNGFTHSFPHDVNAMLINPSGQKLILMGHVGGPYSVTNLTLTFDDGASNSLPSTMLSSGVYLPTQIAPQDVFPGISGTPDGTTLSVFDGMPASGAWSLYVYDDTPGNGGNIASWTLGLTSINPISPAARLSVMIAHSPDPVFTDNTLFYQVVVSNLGPSTASNVVLTDILPAGESFVSGAASQGTVAGVAGTVTVSLGSIPVGATAFVSLQAQPHAAGIVSNTVTVTTSSTDLYPQSTTATDTANVIASPKVVLAAQVLAGGNVQIILSGQALVTYAIQESSDLVTWKSVVTNSSATGTITFTDNSTNAADRFFRAVRVSQ